MQGAGRCGRETVQCGDRCYGRERPRDDWRAGRGANGPRGAGGPGTGEAAQEAAGAPACAAGAISGASCVLAGADLREDRLPR